MLSEQQAAQVIAWLGRRVRQAEAPLDHIAGVAGRRGYPEHRRVPPTAAAWRTLWRCAAALGMNRAELDRFIQRHYRSAGLQGVASLRTMADMNRVLWGLKAVLRHRTKPGDCARQPRRAA
ncbi:MAG TPA: hypothetical protein VNN17_13575 [Terriglobia bacterium]|nr:hypothetical protein [Terriglobia bacterium]